jgi:ABC-type oligopeptide transport system ATPase subunit
VVEYPSAHSPNGIHQAVKGISFSIPKGKTLGLVGESGCGKTSTGMSIARLAPRSGGRILWQGNEISKLSNPQFEPYRKKIQVIFQNPVSSLNPRLTIFQSLGEALKLGHPKEKKSWEDIALETLSKVGLQAETLHRYPHEFSGGQLQRIGIARALCVGPELLICDEPVSSLDVSIQAQILNLLLELQAQLGLTYLFISHDLNVVHHIAQEVVIMAQGQVQEIGNTEQIFKNPQSPYTQELIQAIPN